MFTAITSLFHPTAKTGHLDPIEVLATCALLKYKEPNSLLAFSDGKSTIQQPSQYQCGELNFRWAVRTLSGQSRNDLDVINRAIRIAEKLYQPQRKEHEVYKTLFKKAVEGMDELKKSYKNKANGGVAVAAIDGYQRSIKLLTVKKNDTTKPELDAAMLKIKNLWNVTDVGKINVFLKQMEEKQKYVTIDRQKVCEDEIKQMELLLDQKRALLQKTFRR